MISGWELWLLLVGLAIGAAIVFVALVRLPRAEDDVSDVERHSEAGWIAEAIERGGGVAPPSFVEEVLELHQDYLRTPRVPLPRGAAAPPVAPVPPLPPTPFAQQPSPYLQPGPYPQPRGPYPQQQPSSPQQQPSSPQQRPSSPQQPVEPPGPQGPLPPRG